MNKNDNRDKFLAILSSSTPDQINELIKQKGKEPNPLPIVIFY